MFFCFSIILFFLLFNNSKAFLSNAGAITTSQNKVFILDAVSKSISMLDIKIPPKAEIGSASKAAK